ncbi:MYO5A-like protein, partial [Mya arenaria]
MTVNGLTIVAAVQADLEKEDTWSLENVAQVEHRERNYMGMLKYKKEDEPELLRRLILKLNPNVASSLVPGLPAFVLFMCVRHTDYIDDDEKVISFLTNTIDKIEQVVREHHDDLDRVTLWLANTCRLLHTLKQYSGEKQFKKENTPRQNEHCLRNFDLSEYRQVFSDLAVWIYQTLIKLMENTIQPYIVAAVLNHEAFVGLKESKPGGLRGHSSSRDDETPERSLGSLMKAMTQFLLVLTQHAVDPELVYQIYRQDSGAGSSLEPIVQASQLLQARKTDADVDSVCDMCSKLTVPQQKLKERENTDTTFLMDLKFTFPVTFAFIPSKIILETIEVPEQLHINKLVSR